MSSEDDGPKLYSTKPKKSQLKKATPAPNPVSTAMDPPAPPPPSSAPPSQSFVRRFKFIIPAVLTVSLATGGYLFLRTTKKPKTEEDGEVTATTPSTPAATTPTITPTTTKVVPRVIEKPVTPPPLVEPVKAHEPIPKDQQRELFKWILEEKRKVKPINREEKKRIDEEKAILKDFIRAKSIPSF